MEEIKKTLVYILNACEPLDETMHIGLYSTKEKAEEAEDIFKKMEEDNRYTTWITEEELDRMPDEYRDVLGDKEYNEENE